MKLIDIKSITDIYKCADIWYKRAHQLRKVFQNTEESEKRIKKATVLWTIMYQKVMICQHLVNKLNKPKFLEFTSGGMISFKESGREIIIDKKGNIHSFSNVNEIRKND